MVVLQSLVRVWKESSSTRMVLRKVLDAGLSKHQISDLFNSQGVLRTANLSPHTAIERFSGVRNGKIRADFYDDCQDIPDPSALDPTQKNMLLLDDCFLGRHKVKGGIEVCVCMCVCIL